jgi:hypothetical protein
MAIIPSKKTPNKIIVPLPKPVNRSPIPPARVEPDQRKIIERKKKYKTPVE